MFLATTALTDYWPLSDEEVLFLSSGCLCDQARDEWATRRHRILPNPWDDVTRLQAAMLEVDASAERLLVRLADYLNRVHQLSFSVRYWRIVLGPWLMHYVHAAYDRYTRLEQALTQHPGLHTMLADPASYRIAQDGGEYSSWLMSDRYHLQLCSQLMQAMGYQFPVRRLTQQTREAAPIAPIPSRPFLAMRSLEWMLRSRMTMAGRARNGRFIWLYGMPCSVAQLWRLAWRLRGQAVVTQVSSRRSFGQSPALMNAARNGLGALDASTDFERAAVQALPFQLPTVYLEGYRDARAQMSHDHPRLPSVIVSATGWYADEPFKLLAAEAAEQGSRLVAVQHGGGYGMFRWIALEQHELRFADTFAAWGWGPDGDAQIRNLPSPSLSALRPRGGHARTGGSILFISTAHLRYLLRFHSFPIGVQTEAYQQWQRRFFSAMPPQLRAEVRFRPYMVDYGDDATGRLQREFPDVQVRKGGRFDECASRARLVVIDHCSTTVLESLRIGTPTIVFWDPRLTDVRDEAEPFLERLRQAGILWNSPESAAAHLARIAQDPWQWWALPSVQEARRRFIERYALGDARWVSSWTRAMTEELTQAGSRRRTPQERIAMPVSHEMVAAQG